MSEVKGEIIIIKRNGQDRVSYPLVSNSCLFGSGMDCDIRVQLPSVSERHCVFRVGAKGKVFLSSLSQGNITLLNNVPVSRTVPVNHKDILTVVDRCFRFEYPEESAHYVPDDSVLPFPEVKPLKIISPREKPPHSNVFQMNGNPRKTPSSVKKAVRKSLESAKAQVFGDEVSPLLDPKKTYSKKSLALSAKRKSVSFGPTLSPEQFDKNMPPATPVRRGSLPRRHATTPDYFGSPIITQYPRLKKSRPSVVPREQGIAEETPEAAKQSLKNSYGAAVSPKSQSPSVINRSSPKIKGSPVPQQERRRKSPGVPRKSPLAKKSPKSVSSKQSLASPPGRGRTKPSDIEPDLPVSLSDSPVSLSSSPRQTVIKTHKNSPIKSRQNTPKDKGSPSKLSPLKVWASVVSPSSKNASPLSRRKSSLHSSENSSSVVSAPKHSVKNQMNDKKLSSFGKRSPGSHSLKRLSKGKSPARPVALTTPSRKSSPKIPKKTSTASKLRSALPLTPHSPVEGSSDSGKFFSEVSFSEDQNTTDDVGNIISAGSEENSSPDVTTPKSSSKRRLDCKKPSSEKIPSSPRVLKRLSGGKSPALSLSLTTPTRRTGKIAKPESSGKLRSSLPSASNSSVKKASESEISLTEAQPGSVGDADVSQSPFSDQVGDSSQLTPASRFRSKLRGSPKPVAKQPSSPLKQNPPVDAILSPEVTSTDQLTPVSGRRQSRSSMTPKSYEKQVGSSLNITPPVSSPKTPGSKRKADAALASEPAKKTRLSALINFKFDTNRVSPRLQSTPAPVEAKSAISLEELLPKASPLTPAKSRHSTSAAKSSSEVITATTPLKPKLKVSPSKVSPGNKSALAVKSKNKTPIKASPKVTSMASPEEKTKTPNRTLPKSKFTPSPPAKAVTSKTSPKMKSVLTSSKKITPAAKSSVKKVASASKSVKKSGSGVRSPAKSVKKAFSSKKSSKKPLWTEVVRRGIMKKKVTGKPKVVRSLLSNALLKRKALTTSKKNLLKKSVPTPHKKVISLMSTGHVNSPETIVIQKRTTSSQSLRARTSHSSDVHIQTPGTSGVAKTPSTSGQVSHVSSSVKSTRSSLSLSASKRKSLADREKNSPNISSAQTPNISQERFVSPLTTPRVLRTKNSYLEEYVLQNRHLGTSEMNEMPTVKSARKSETPVGVKRLLKADTPKADYTSVAGVKRLLKSPRDSPKADYRDVRGIKRLIRTPKDSPTPDYTNVAGVRNLLRTPASAKLAVPQAKTISIKQLYQNTSPRADYTKVKGVKQLFKAAGHVKGKLPARKAKDKELGREPDFRNVEGVKQLFREPEENEFNISGLQQLFSPVPSISFDSSPVIQDSPSTQDVSSPKSRRKQSFNSPLSTASLNSGNKKPVRMTSPPKNSLEIEHTVSSGGLEITSPKHSLPESLKSPIRHRVTATPESASRTTRSVRSACVTVTPKQPQYETSSVSRRKSSGTAAPSDTPLSSRSDKMKKLSTPANDAISPPHSVVNEESPRLPNVTSKTKRQIPTQSPKEDVSFNRKISQSPKRKSLGKGQKLDVDTSEVEFTSPQVLRDIEKETPVSTPRRVTRGTKAAGVEETPEVVLIDEDSQYDENVSVGLQRTERSRFAPYATEPKVATKKGKRSATQETFDSVLDEAQQMDDKEVVIANLPTSLLNSAGKVSPKKSSRTVQRKKHSPEEELGKQQTDVLRKGGRATRSKKVEATVGDHDVATETPQKTGRSTRSKKDTAEEIVVVYQSLTDVSKKGGRITRGNKVSDLGPVENSSPAPATPSTKVSKRSKAKEIPNKETAEDSQPLSEEDHIEVKGLKRTTRGRGKPVGTPVKNASAAASPQSIVPEYEELAAGKGGSRQTRSRNKPSAEVDSSEPIRTKDRSLRSRDHVNQNTPPVQERTETPTKGRRLNKRKQENSTSGAPVGSDRDKTLPETPSSAKKPRSRRNQNFVPSSSGDSAGILNIEVAATPEERSKSKKMPSKADDVAPLHVVSSNDTSNAPVMSRGLRTRRNQKASFVDSQEDEAIKSSPEVDGASTATRRSKRSNKQESETVSETVVKQSRTHQNQKNVSLASAAENSTVTVDSTDVSGAVLRSRRGKTIKTDVPDEKIEVPDTKRPKKQSKKSSVVEGDSSLSHVDINETAPISRRNRTAGSPSQPNLAAPQESEKPKRGSKMTRGASTASSDVGSTEASGRSRSKRSATDSVDDASPKKRARKATSDGKKSSNTVKKGAKATEPVKTQSTVLEAIEEVEEEEEVAVTPVAASKMTRVKAAAEQTTKEYALRKPTRPTRSRRK